MALRNKPPARPASGVARNTVVPPLPAQRLYDFVETIPLPEVIEKDSDSVWAMWTDATKEPAGKDSDTQPATLLMGLPEFPRDPDSN